MATSTALLLVAAKTVSLVCGGTLAVLAGRAAHRTGSDALRALALGIGLLTTGAVVGGLLHQGLGVPLVTGVAVQSIFTALGLGVMTYSLFAEGRRSSPETRGRTAGD
jgi:hypothetical protein